MRTWLPRFSGKGDRHSRIGAIHVTQDGVPTALHALKIYFTHAKNVVAVGSNCVMYVKKLFTQNKQACLKVRIEHEDQVVGVSRERRQSRVGVVHVTLGRYSRAQDGVQLVVLHVDDQRGSSPGEVR